MFDACVQRLSSTCCCYTKIYIKSLSATFPEPQKAADDLGTFAKLNEGRLYKLLETCMDTQTSLKPLIKSSV
jgi:sister-chromatid-cohesion protein PDS5